MATSASSSRLSQKWNKVNLPLKRSLDDITFLGQNFGHSFKNGSVKLPSVFIQEYLKFVPWQVGLHLPNGEVWLGYYATESECITGLEYLMQYFDVKPYHMVLLEYNGGSEFSLEIFNQYAVEIDYSRTLNVVTNTHFAANHLALARPDDPENLEYEKDSLCASFSYNAYNNSCGAYDLLIRRTHLEAKAMNEVLSSDGCIALGISSDMKWIEIGFKKFRWHIMLTWNDGQLYFNEQWSLFAQRGRLADGDVLVFTRTGHPQKFDVALFEKENRRKYNRGGLKHIKGLLKWFKVMNTEIIKYGQLEIPRVFVEQYGDDLSNNVTLLLRDGMNYSCSYSNNTSVLFDLTDFLEAYTVENNYVVFFDYVGSSCFYVSIYNTAGLEIFNDLHEKLSLTTVLTGTEGEVVLISDSSDSKNEGGNEGIFFESDESDSVTDEATDLTGEVQPNVFILDDSDTSTDNSTATDSPRNEIIEELQPPLNEGIRTFTVSLLRSHVDQNGHGVYLPRYFLPIYRKWKNATVTTLSLPNRSFKVAVHRKGSVCRFGRGWDAFTFQNGFQIGQKLQFTYADNYIFVVTVKA